MPWIAFRYSQAPRHQCKWMVEVAQRAREEISGTWANYEVRLRFQLNRVEILLDVVTRLYLFSSLCG